MLSSRVLNSLTTTRLLLPKAIFGTHTALCPASKEAALPKGPVCPGSTGDGGGGGKTGNGPKRALKSGKVRLFLFPEEWFQFFHSKTGVSGPYVFGIVMINYLVSKEIFIFEHEYYLGLSIMMVMACAVKFLGKDFAAFLDHDVDAVHAEFQKVRDDETNFYKDTIKSAKDAQWRAEGQKELMDAKKENITMQLEAIYRERSMLVYRTVRGRMDYHVKRFRAEGRIHQKWMIGWILDNVMKSITPDFEKQALDAAIQELVAVSSRT